MSTLAPQKRFRLVLGGALVLLLSGGVTFTQAETVVTPIDPPESAAVEAVAASTAAETAPLLSPAELETVVAPIALYPDDLVAIVLPASTYPLQVVQAARFLESVKTDSSLKPDPAWDDSVVALTNYPEVVELMNRDLDWTWKLGQAVINQQSDVLSAVEDFRRSANAAGNLKTDDRQVVSVTPEVVEVKPADPKVIYVPYYEPAQVTVYQPYPVYHYYPIAYPVYYYPYPDDYVFGWPYFWGVTTFYSLGWSTHNVSYYQYYDYGHPYYASRYCDRWYYRRPYYAGNSDWHHNDWNNRWDDNNRNHNDGHQGGRSWNHDGRRGGARPDGGWHRNRDGDRNSTNGTWAGRSGDGRRDDNWTGQRDGNSAIRHRDGDRSSTNAQRTNPLPHENGNRARDENANALQQANAASPLRSRWADRSGRNAMNDVAARQRGSAQRSNARPANDALVTNVGQRAKNAQLRARNDADQRVALSDHGAPRMNGQRDATLRSPQSQRGAPAPAFAAVPRTDTSRTDRSRALAGRADTTRVRPQPGQAERMGSRPQVAQMDRNLQRTAQQQRFTARTEVPRARERPVQQVPRATQQRFASQQVQQAPRVQQQAFREQRAPRVQQQALREQHALAPQQRVEHRGNGGEQRGSGRSQQDQRVASAQGDARGNGRGGFRSSRD